MSNNGYQSDWGYSFVDLNVLTKYYHALIHFFSFKYNYRILC